MHPNEREILVSTEQRQTVDAILRQSAFPVGSSVDEQRRLFREAVSAQPLPADVTVAAASLGGVPTAEITVDGIEPRHVVVYFHGGVYVISDAFLAAGLASQVARRTQARVISVDYRLAPEHPYPAAVDDALAAKLVPGKTLTGLREMIEHDLEHAKEHDLERGKEAQILKYLHERIQVELPPALVQNETRRALAELVQRNRERGVTDDMLKDKEKELIEVAAGMAAHRLKTNFILHRIAEHENIQVTKEDLDSRIKHEAARYDITPDKMHKELQQRNALDDLAEQLLLGKTLDFLKANVSVELTKETSVKEEKS